MGPGSQGLQPRALRGKAPAVYVNADGILEVLLPSSTLCGKKSLFAKAEKLSRWQTSKQIDVHAFVLLKGRVKRRQMLLRSGRRQSDKEYEIEEERIRGKTSK